MNDTGQKSVKTICNLCNKSAVNKKTICINCDAVFHNSCSTKKNKSCCEKPLLKLPETIEAESEDENEYLVEKSIIWENAVLKEINNELREHNKLLKEKINDLENEITDLKSGNENQTSTDLSQEQMASKIISIVNCKFEKQINSLADQLKELKLEIQSKTNNNKHKANSNSNDVSEIYQEKRNVNNSEETPGKWKGKNIVNKPKQTGKKISYVEKTQHDSKNYENVQKDIMNSIINLEINGHSEKQSNHTTEEDQWIRVTRKSKKFKKTIGEYEADTGNFKGMKPKVWMFLYRVKHDVQEQDIINYLTNKTGQTNDEFMVRHLTTTENNHKCFSVAADFKFKDDFYDPLFWPRGVGYRRLDFRTDVPQNTRKPASFLGIK